MRDLERDLKEAVAGEVRFDTGTRAAYATDASNFRMPPIGVVIPASIDDVVATHRVCRAHNAPILPRGCGTSLAGSAVNHAVVIDFSRHLDAVLGVDAQSRRARVQPGAINDRVNHAAGENGLRFGPDPATHAYCTIGGNIATNACGVHSVQARFDGDGSRTSDNVARVEVLTYDGVRTWVGPTSEDEIGRIVAAGGRRGQIYRDLRDLRDRYGDSIRERFLPIPRRVSGYNLDDLLPERGFNLAAALSGTEGTCVTILEAELKLIPRPRHRSLLVAGYEDIFGAADHVREILAARPMGCETFDHALLGTGQPLTQLPEGGAWVLVELGGDTTKEADGRARALGAQLRAHPSPPAGVRHLDDPAEVRRLWEVREAGLAASSFPPGLPDHYSGWEDTAVAPEDLGAYLRDLRRLYDKYGYTGAFYGHLGDGCIHARTSFDFRTPKGLADYRSFLEEGADLVVSHGGSLSGEHGDGQQRAELLPRMFGDELVRAFQEFKAIWDPEGRMNPGKVVDPLRLDQNLRLGPAYRPGPPKVKFSYPEDRGDFAHTAVRCVGVGKCRQPHPAGVMCPSFVATREERHSTRGRARLLYEMLQGDVVTDGWRSPEVAEALDLCLACKGCTAECPVGVDMPTYKAEFLHHHFEGRLRPRHAYAFGLIDRTARLASRLPGLANFLTGTPPFAQAVKRAAGMAANRTVPRFSPVPLQRWFRSRDERNPGGPRVVLWPDTFTNYFDTGAGMAAVEAIEAAGWRVLMPETHVCCGRPLYDYGFLDLAEKYLLRTLEALGPAVAEGLPVLGLEPSCVAVFRHELPRLLPGSHAAVALSRRVFGFSEFFERYNLPVPRLSRRVAVMLWVHCHQKATGGGDHDRRLLEAMGAEVEVIAGTCCGLAGSWGMEAAHHSLSMTIAEGSLLPAIRAAAPGTLIVANGFSCRMQIAQGGGGRRGIHVAEVMRGAET